MGYGGKRHMFCVNCGTELPDDANFCLKCGKSQKEKVDQGTSSVTIGTVDGGIHDSTIAGRDVEQMQVTGNVETSGDFFTGDKVDGDKVGRDQVEGDQTTIREISDSTVGVGRGAQVASVSEGGTAYQAQGDIVLGKAKRDEQYQIVLNWDGKTRLRGFDLSGRDLSGLKLDNADLQGSNLQGVNLRETSLVKADLRNTNLQWVDLSELSLINVDLRDSNLQGANLWETSLVKADLRNANLKGARFWKTDLYGADLRDTDLQEAKLSGANLQAATYDEYTIWPDGFDPEKAGAVLVDG